MFALCSLRGSKFDYPVKQSNQFELLVKHFPQRIPQKPKNTIECSEI